MASLDRLSLNLATFEGALDLNGALDLLARNGIRHAAPTRRQWEEDGPRQVSRSLRGAGIAASSLADDAGFIAEGGSDRRRLLDAHRRAIEAAAEIGAPCLTVAGGGLLPGFKDLTGARHMVEDGLASILDDALAAGVVLAIEPSHPMRAAANVVTTLRQALDICDGLGSSGVAVALDLFATWWDPALPGLIEPAGRRIVLCQLADWPAASAGMPAERMLMGDGVIAFQPWLRLLAEHGYDRPIEVEIVSRFWREREPLAFLHAIMERFESAC